MRINWNWESLSTSMKHMVLMYLFRLKTEPPEEMENYIETYHYRKLGITKDQIPKAYLELHPTKIREAAYAVINRPFKDIPKDKWNPGYE